MRGLLAVWRILCSVVHLLHGVLICAFVFPFVGPQQQARRVGWWSARMLRMLGVSLRVDGMPRGGATLVVANHISWLDILAINAACPVRFVSKADVRHWPLIGWLVAAAGTLFIERERKRDALRVVHQVAQALKQGHTVALFPEGTTTEGHALLPFHANLFQAAISTGTPVQPVVLRFSDADGPISAAAAYVGDMNLLESLWAIVTARQLSARVTWLLAEGTEHADRRALAEHMRRQIDGALNVKEWRSAAG
ncbi:lysophospholipid acyltransferase family protein [Piscinibacter sp.]|uniref:lysophospholipid acyltransferase family protein n=1 Tax=Piscinibacter sp. TaxID=1903157 RepID=UPI002C99CF18|nr:lysophospholipid acyltransferase family protein [Albitalea sp.]HUG23834.1 lysophospholipid acyltransferase family protein [Albitalea sp.]